jgi:protein TonB
MEMDLALPNIDIPLSLSGTPYLGDFAKSTKKGATIGKPSKPVIDTNVVPTLRIPPQYPARALRSGIEGVVTVEFTIAIDGSVKDPVIVKSKPPKIFDQAVLKSITKWKFNPDMVDGKPVEKRARQEVKFKLER